MGIILFLFVGLMCLACLGLALYAIIMWIYNSANNTINGVMVNATIKGVVNKKDKDTRNDATYDQHIELECEFEYNGKLLNKTLYVYNEIDEGKYRVGDNIQVKYNPKTKKLVDELNLKGPDNRRFFAAVISGVVMAVYGLFFYKDGYLYSEVIMISLGIIFWYLSIFVFYDFYYIKDKKKYIKLKGHVIDYHVRYDTDDHGSWNYYCPEISFKYNHEKKKYISTRSSLKKRYNIGQEVDVYYNPETDRIYEMNSNKFWYIFMAIPPICALIVLIQYLVK